MPLFTNEDQSTAEMFIVSRGTHKSPFKSSSFKFSSLLSWLSFICIYPFFLVVVVGLIPLYLSIQIPIENHSFHHSTTMNMKQYNFRWKSKSNFHFDISKHSIRAQAEIASQIDSQPNFEDRKKKVQENPFLNRIWRRRKANIFYMTT